MKHYPSYSLQTSYEVTFIIRHMQDWVLCRLYKKKGFGHIIPVADSAIIEDSLETFDMIEH